MRSVTGTHVYTYPKCAHAVWLDLCGDRERRRDLREDEELLLARGRDHEARIVAGLGWPEPAYEPRDFGAGAAATAELLRAGVPGVSQGVLVGRDRLGIPDLLRRERGESGLGAFHYVVGDIKSSRRPRGDQVLQVAFYSELLAELQGRRPEYGYLLLRDGREERFELEPFAPALVQVVGAIDALRSGSVVSRPFASRGCESCRWSEVCAGELAERGDLSLLAGMTRGVRAALEAGGVTSVETAAELAVDRAAAATGLEPALLRRVRAAARARLAGGPLRDRPAARMPGGPAAVVHGLFDPFAERALFLGLRLAAADAEPRCELPPAAGDELAAFLRLLDGLPARAPLLHYGPALPRWFDAVALGHRDSLAIEARFVDLAPRLRGVAIAPRPVFGFEDHVTALLGRDGRRAGRASGAAAHADDPAWLRSKGENDLRDLSDLTLRWLSPRR